MVLLHRGMCSCHESIFFFRRKQSRFLRKGILSSNVEKSKAHFYRSIYQKKGVVRKEFLVRICWIQFVNVPASEQNLECP